MKDAAELLNLIGLEQIEHNIFRGDSAPVVGARVFGGQVLAQALQAAIRTVPEDRLVHSLHGYFILAGDASRPIVYEVERLRDGGSFTTRRITAIQHGRAIFNMSASFQLMQDGLDHQVDMPVVPPPEQLPTSLELAEQYRDQVPGLFERIQRRQPIQFKPVETPDWIDPRNRPPFQHTWVRFDGQLPDAFAWHQTILAYASDYFLLGTSIKPHRAEHSFANLQVASLDHAMWFHREFRADEWMLYAIDSPSASRTRGFNRGNLFSRDGRLVASVVQEGLIRPKRK